MRRWWSWGVSSSSHMTPLDWEKMVQHISQWNNCVPRAGNVECGEWRWMVMVIMMMSKWCWWCWYWYLNYQFSDIFLIALGCQLVLRLFRWQSSMFRFQPKKFNALHLKSLQKGESELGNLGFGLLFPVCSFQGWCNWDILVGQLDEWILATKYTLAADFSWLFGSSNNPHGKKEGTKLTISTFEKKFQDSPSHTPPAKGDFSTWWFMEVIVTIHDRTRKLEVVYGSPHLYRGSYMCQPSYRGELFLNFIQLTK